MLIVVKLPVKERYNQFFYKAATIQLKRQVFTFNEGTTKASYSIVFDVPVFVVRMPVQRRGGKPRHCTIQWCLHSCCESTGKLTATDQIRVTGIDDLELYWCPC